MYTTMQRSSSHVASRIETEFFFLIAIICIDSRWSQSPSLLVQYLPRICMKTTLLRHLILPPQLSSSLYSHVHRHCFKVHHRPGCIFKYNLFQPVFLFRQKHCSGNINIFNLNCSQFTHFSHTHSLFIHDSDSSSSPRPALQPRLPGCTCLCSSV